MLNTLRRASDIFTPKIEAPARLGCHRRQVARPASVHDVNARYSGGRKA